MTEEQMAINRLKCGNTAHSCKADYIQIAIKALEKQVPKKPKESSFQNNMFPQCPICDEILRINQSFCDGCGQKLDWE